MLCPSFFDTINCGVGVGVGVGISTPNNVGVSVGVGVKTSVGCSTNATYKLKLVLTFYMFLNLFCIFMYINLWESFFWIPDFSSQADTGVFGEGLRDHWLRLDESLCYEWGDGH